MEIWFVTTDHLSKRIWFRDDEDFKMGMNLVAVLAVALSVKVVSFILMSNHVHFVLCCSNKEAHRFIEEFKRRYSQYASKKYGTKELLRRVRVRIDLVDGNDESFEWVVAYTHMNSVAANICLNASDYRWGTGGAFFKSTPSKGRRLDTFSQRARFALLHSEQKMPPHLLVGEDDYILPASYVQVEMVETIFRTQADELFPAEFFQGETPDRVQRDRTALFPRPSGLVGHSGSLPIPVPETVPGGIDRGRTNRIAQATPFPLLFQCQSAHAGNGSPL